MSPAVHPLVQAARAGATSEVHRLLASNPGPDECREAFTAALELRSLDMMTLLAPHALRLPARFYAQALKLSAEVGHLPAVQALLQVGHHRGEVPALQAAVEGGHPAIVSLIARRRTPLQVGKVLVDCVARATPETVEALLGADVPAESLSGALLVAIHWPRSQVIDMLGSRFTVDERYNILKGCIKICIAFPNSPRTGMDEFARMVPVSHLMLLEPEHLACLPQAQARVKAFQQERSLEQSLEPSAGSRLHPRF